MMSLTSSLVVSLSSRPVPPFSFAQMADFTALVRGLTNPELREKALLELSKKREAFQDLAPILWHSVGTISALLQEIVTIYPLLSPPDLTAPASNRVCNALALLQCVASHPETRTLFLNAHIPLYLYPFLNTVNTSRPFEYLRLTSLGVIGALVKMDDSDVINFLLQTEIIPLCLRIMETGTELSKTVATFIVQKILMDDMGLQYICQTAERFYAVSQVLSNMVGIEARVAIEAGAEPAKRPSGRLIKHIVRCYLRVCDNTRAREALRASLPDALRDNVFADVLKKDQSTTRWLNELVYKVDNAGAAGAGGAPGSGAPGGRGQGGPSQQQQQQLRQQQQQQQQQQQRRQYPPAPPQQHQQHQQHQQQQQFRQQQQHQQHQQQYRM